MNRAGSVGDGDDADGWTDARTDPSACTDSDLRTGVFQRHRRLLFAVAYDILGSVSDAEDCVRETLDPVGARRPLRCREPAELPGTDCD